MARFAHARLSAGIGAGVIALVVPFAASIGPASASGPGPNTPTAVPGDVNVAAIPGTVKLGATDPSTPETVSFVLRERNIGQLEFAAQHGIRKFKTVAQFASAYGQTQAHITALTSYLSGFGITTNVYANKIDVVATGTVGQFDSALGTHQATFRVPGQPSHHGMMSIPAQTVHSATSPATLPHNIASYVAAVLGLSNYAGLVSSAQHVDPSIAKPTAASGSAVNCAALTGLPNACNLPSNFASRYNLNGLYAAHANGAGQTLAIVTLAALDVGGPEYYWKNIAHIKQTSRTVKVVNIDGGPGAPSASAGTGETDLDVEQAGGLAPGANVIVYQAPNTDPGFVDAFFQAATDNKASTVSSSWGESETVVKALVKQNLESAGYEAAFDEAFLEMAAQGQSGFMSTGDEGAYTAAADLGTTNLSVGEMVDSPYITAAGGTTLPWKAVFTKGSIKVTVSVTKQRAWGWDYLWNALHKLNGGTLASVAESNVAGDGGGFSNVEWRPSYQQRVSGTGNYHAVRYLIPTAFKTVQGLWEPTAWKFNAKPHVIAARAHGRAIPDLSTDADPYSGYLLYAPSNGAGKELQGGWGGTSFVAPQLNGATAVIDSYLHHRVGLWNPAIYAFATGRNTPFTQLNTAGTSNDNLFYSGNPGQRYNPAVGLGVPNLTRLARDFARYGF